MNVNKCIANLTLDEKAQLLTAKASLETTQMSKIGVFSKKLTDGPHGVRFDRSGHENATCFPSLCAIASSWNKSLVERMGVALGKECIHFQKDMLLGPGINIKRHILCGRNFEYFSEDPVLSGELGAAYICGLQSQGISACLKHFAANNQEKNRDTINVEVDERTLREIYLKAFQIAIQKGKPDAVMCAYNKLHAIWCSENPYLLTQILRDEWGFDGLVVSDWDAVQNAAHAIRAGLDLIMPQRENLLEEIQQALKQKHLSEKDVDQAVSRVLKWSMRDRHNDNDFYLRECQHQEAIAFARESIVLLKNEKQALPLTVDKYHKIAVIGEHGLHPLMIGQGSAEVYPQPEYITSPLLELQKAMPNAEFKYVEMYHKTAMPEQMLWPKLNDFRAYVSDCDAIILFAGEMESESTESFDRRSAELNPNMEFFIEAACGTGKRVIVVLQSGGALILGKWHRQVDAILQMWLAGEGAGRAIADILTGAVNPSGKLAETFPNQLRTDVDFGDDTRVCYREGMDVGYRYYDKHIAEITFPFGHGLSYTSFEYTKGQISIDQDTAKIDVVLKNIGDYAGAEVIQLYIAMQSPIDSRPIKELKAFEKVFLESGQSKQVEFELSVDDLGYYNPMLHCWITETGTYHFLLGASSQDIRITLTADIECDMRYSIQRTREATIAQVL